MRHALATGLLSAGLIHPGAAQTQERKCPDTPVEQIAFREGSFDAWIVDSTIRAGTSTVVWTASGCALLESWVGAVSGDGTALYVHYGERWHLVFVNASGGTLNLAGQRDEAGGILFEGRHPHLDGRPGEHRMRLAPEGRDVRQTWHFRPDATAEWELLVDIIQHRLPPAD